MYDNTKFVSQYQREKLNKVNAQVENTKTFMNMAIHDLRAPSHHIIHEVNECHITIKNYLRDLKIDQE